MNTLKISAVSLAITATILATVYMFVTNIQPVVGATIQGNDYEHVSYAGSTAFGATVAGGAVKVGSGAIGSVVITGANSGVLVFYDATTTNANLRAATQSTSSIYIASMPASVAAGTYIFDVTFGRGLIIDVIGSAPTSTVTYR